MENKFDVSSWAPVGGRERRIVEAKKRPPTGSFGQGGMAQEMTKLCRPCQLRIAKICGGLHADAGNQEHVFNATRKPPNEWPEGINGTVFPCDTL